MYSHKMLMSLTKGLATITRKNLVFPSVSSFQQTGVSILGLDEAVKFIHDKIIDKNIGNAKLNDNKKQVRPDQIFRW